MSERTPMSFQSERAFSHLKEEGLVFTFRREKRSYEGPVWIRRKRGGKKEFSAIAAPPLEIEYLDELAVFAPFSGFETLGGWKEKIGELHGEEKGYLFYVEREKGRRDE